VHVVLLAQSAAFTEQLGGVTENMTPEEMLDRTEAACRDQLHNTEDVCRTCMIKTDNKCSELIHRAEDKSRSMLLTTENKCSELLKQAADHIAALISD